MSNFSEMITAGMNNPDCAFWVGSTMGPMHQMNILYVLLAFLAYKFLAVSVIEPQAEKLKQWIKKRKPIFTEEK